MSKLGCTCTGNRLQVTCYVHGHDLKIIGTASETASIHYQCLRQELKTILWHKASQLEYAQLILHYSHICYQHLTSVRHVLMTKLPGFEMSHLACAKHACETILDVACADAMIELLSVVRC